MATKPTRKAFGRSLSDFPKLSKIERKLLDHCRRGVLLEIGDGTRPEKPSGANKIRPELIRFLMLGGDAENAVHEEGVQMWGAWIDGNLNLTSCKCKNKLGIGYSTLNGVLLMQDCALLLLNLQGSSVAGINADGAIFAGDLFLRKKFEATGEVRLLGAQIGGDLDCTNASFLPKKDYALTADGAVIKGRVFLDEDFSATAPLSFASAQIGAFIDTPKLWPKDSVLDGLTYKSFVGGSPTDAGTRIKWLHKQPRAHLYEDFRPQPWEQLIKVLRDMGHKDDADEVAIAKQEQLYRAGKITGPNRIWH